MQWRSSAGLHGYAFRISKSVGFAAYYAAVQEISNRSITLRHKLTLAERRFPPPWSVGTYVGGSVLNSVVSRITFFSMLLLEPISKSFEEDHEAGELDEAEEVLAVVLPADEDAALPLDPGEEAFDEPTSHVTA